MSYDVSVTNQKNLKKSKRKIQVRLNKQKHVREDDHGKHWSARGKVGFVNHSRKRLMERPV